MKFKHLLLVSFSCLTFLTGCNTESDSGTAILDFYSVNDFHGAVEYNEYSKELGITRLGTYLKEKEKENPNGTIILSAGDMFQGSADSNITRGKLVVETMNEIGFDAMAIGNHEFDWGVEYIKSNSEIANFPFLGANIFSKEEGALSDLGQPYTMVEKNGVKVGIIGTIGERLTNSILPSEVENYTFMPQTTIVNNYAKELRGAGADVVVLLTHESFTNYRWNRDLSNLVCYAMTDCEPSIDAIFTGHEHAYDAQDVNGVPIVQALGNGRGVGHVQLKVDKKTNEVTSLDYAVDDQLCDYGLEEDTGVKSIYQRFLDEEINVVKNEVVGNLVGNLKRYDKDNANGLSPLSQFAINVLAKYGESYGASIALHNLKGLRADLYSGQINVGHIYKVFPFDNKITIMNVKGSDLASIMRYHYTDSIHSPYYGISIDGKTLSDGTAIENDKIYKIVTIDYLSENIKYYPSISVETTPKMMRDLVIEEFKNKGTIYSNDYN